MLTDLRYAIRSYLRTPGFTIVALVTLALGIGGATAIFSVVNGILLRPLPYASADRIMQIRHIANDREEAAFSPADFLDIKREASHLTSVAGYREDIVDLTGNGDPVRVRGVQTTAAFFDALNVAPVAGRLYHEQTDTPGPLLAVIAEGLWRQRFGGGADVVGTTIRVNGQPTEIVGVVPESFRHPLPADIWTLSPEAVPLSPIDVDDALASREVQYFGAVGLLEPGATEADADAQLAAIAERLSREFPDTNTGDTFRVLPLSDALVADVRTALLVLLGAVACVLLIACANVAGLMLARSSARRRELAVRSSLGAGVGRIARQLLTECVVLAFVGGLAGVLLAAWLQDLLLALAPDTIPRLGDVTLDWRVGLVAFAVTTVVGVAFGIFPALQSARAQVSDDLKDGGRTGTTGKTVLRSGLVVAQITVALVLLIGAGLMVSSLRKLEAVDPGFRTTGLVAIELPVPQARYDESGQRRFYSDVLARVQTNPATARAAMIFPFPLRGSSAGASYEIDGQPAPRSEQRRADLNAASPDFVQTMGLRLVRGRTFEPTDGPDSTPVAIISERLAAEWGDRDPVGSRINLGSWFTVVGVVSDVRRTSLEAPPRAAVYLPYQQFTLPYMGVIVRTTAPASAVAGVVRSAVHELDPDLPIGEVATIEDIIVESTGQPRFRTVLILAFAAVALMLAGVGIYGLISFVVAQRTAEMGVRLALGASPWQVCRLVMSQGLWLAATGIAAGAVVAVIVTRTIAGLLFETSATDPGIYAGLAALLLTIAALACYVPARRAMRVDPVRALRAE